MKAIMVMFDSLNRHYLPPYGCDWIHAPNFKRLAKRTVTFDNAYVGSMPCMPARRELHTGRYNFLHRSWGPLEPFDDSMPELLSKAGTHTCLSSDHIHYWEDGGCTYHQRYDTWHMARGQEADKWFADLTGKLKHPKMAERKRPEHWFEQDNINRARMHDESDWPQAKTFAAGLDFLENNHEADNWFLQIETFDPHEPFFAPQKFRDLYPHDYDGPQLDWPDYYHVVESRQEINHLRYEYAALLSMCDAWLGKVLDFMDAHDMWQDIMLIVNTDHGFLLGEHDLWAKCHCPFYNEIAHMPLFIWDPRSAVSGERRQSLVQTIDLPPTLLNFFNQPIPEDMQGLSLRETIKTDAPVREAGLFGLFGNSVSVTDGRYLYMREADYSYKGPRYEYTMMPTHIWGVLHP